MPDANAAPSPPTPPYPDPTTPLCLDCNLDRAIASDGLCLACAAQVDESAAPECTECGLDPAEDGSALCGPCIRAERRESERFERAHSVAAECF